MAEAVIVSTARTGEMTDAPFGVNLTFLPSSAPYPEYIAAIIEGGVKIVETAGRSPEQYMPALKAGRHQGHSQMHLRSSFAESRAHRLRRGKRRRFRVRRSSRRR
jgi:hypothetical protein